MLFSSLSFLYYFLPCVLIIYFLAPKKLKNSVLLLSSLFFYAWGEPKYVLLMLLAILCGYLFALLIERYRGRRLSRLFLILSVSLSAAILGFFKYADFFIQNFNAVTGLSLPLLRIALPIGISFYTFQLISYTVDVYRGVPAQRSFIDLAAYISLFPQLIAGPIVRYSQIAEQLSSRRHSLDKAALGIRRFILGLGKKVLIANAMGQLCEIFRASQDKSVLFFWLYAIANMLHIYFDFSGYSDMAIGLGKLFGFDFPENFNYPYISRSVTEFWRRWHISLGSWFRDYVYIPMGGNRVSRPRWLLNILVVWLLTGFWHGAAWNFIVWGLFFAVFLILEKLWLLKHLEKAPVLGRFYVLFTVMLSFIIFSAENMGQALSSLSSLFGAGGLPLLSAEFLYYLKSYAVLLLIAVVGATPLPRLLLQRLGIRPGGEKLRNLLEVPALLLILALSTAYLVDGSFNPFLYFRF
ncbi:MAG: MBOAT family protein [Candidatus Limivicinus sp.]|nr:MBOAT family protein [Candidatus Limivicinus sp.]